MRSVRSRPSLPTAQIGSTPPNGTPGTLRAGPPGGGGGGSLVGGGVRRCTRGWLMTAAPFPGSPTALSARPPPPPPGPPNPVGARGVHRLGAAIKPPGQRHVLPGMLPVAAAYVRLVVQYGLFRSVSTANSWSLAPPTTASDLNPM